MLDQDRIDYYRRRAAAERELAEKASNPLAAKIHEHLAATYARIVQAASGTNSPSA